MPRKLKWFICLLSIWWMFLVRRKWVVIISSTMALEITVTHFLQCLMWPLINFSGFNSRSLTTRTIYNSVSFLIVLIIILTWSKKVVVNGSKLKTSATGEVQTPFFLFYVFFIFLDFLKIYTFHEIVKIYVIVTVRV